MPDPITWKVVNRQIKDLIPWPRNPRQIDQEQGNRLLESWEEFGQVETIAIGPANEVYNGHQRLKVLGARFGGDFSVECRQSSRPLTEKEREKLTIFLHRGTVGDWDWDALANEFEQSELLQWGFKPGDLGLDDSSRDSEYTRKIEAPVYRPSLLLPPALSELIDRTRTESLLQAIETSTLPEDEKAFLRLAANRHIIFNYRNIAEYYAHASPAMQQLMEDSGLVIIDFQRAIELGFVKLSKEIIALYQEDED